MQILAAETAADHTCKQLMHVIMEGWPRDSNNLFRSSKPFYGYCDELYGVDNVVMKGQQAVIWTKLHQECLIEILKGYAGAEAMKRRARECVFWPVISQDIDDFTPRCPGCNMQHEAKSLRVCVLASY